MLISLSIRNYVLIESLTMELDHGLNTLTGETGAGKSIMLGAVGLLLGERADTRTLLNEDEKCVIEGQFDIGKLDLTSFFEENDLDFEKITVIRREIAPSGKSRAFVNDTPVLLEILKELGSRLVDIHSQHDTLLLSDNRFQLQILDTLGNNSTYLSNYHLLYEQYRKAVKAHNKLKDQSAELKREYEFNRFILDELEKARLDEIDQLALEEEQKTLDHTEEIKLSLNQSMGLLEGNEFSILQMLYEVKQQLSRIAGFGERFGNLHQRIEQVVIELNDLHSELEREDGTTEFDPVRSEEIASQLSELYRLYKKHSSESVTDLVKLRDQLTEKVLSVENLDEEIDRLAEQEIMAREKVIKAGEELSARRRKSAETLVPLIIQTLNRLSIPEAKLEIEFQSQEPGATGMDQVTFLFSANRGIAVQELKKVASGGEFSRLMFALKHIMAGKTALPTLLFDEIDTGISGEVARQMGLMMKSMGSSMQVIAITHLPQVAALGGRHFFVYKSAGKNSTVSQLRLLSEEERILEIAKMIAGENPSESALASARELIL